MEYRLSKEKWNDVLRTKKTPIRNETCQDSKVLVIKLQLLLQLSELLPLKTATIISTVMLPFRSAAGTAAASNNREFTIYNGDADENVASKYNFTLS